VFATLGDELKDKDPTVKRRRFRLWQLAAEIRLCIFCLGPCKTRNLQFRMLVIQSVAQSEEGARYSRKLS